MLNSVYVYANGIACLPDMPVEYDANKIVFIGNMRTLQNQDAARFFAADIFTIIKQAIPSAMFYIIGAEPPAHIKNLADGKNIVVSGFVKSVEDEIKNAAVSVAPVRIAAGIQNKVLVSMACGIPVVLTSIITDAIPELISGENCLIADKTEDFANACITLIQNKSIHNSIAKNGYNLMKYSYSWNKRLEGYER
jgi:glycosyltransferase involved in cell wall biosynthesis